MSGIVDARLKKLFDEAERGGRCAAPERDADRMALARRMPRGDLVQPHPGLFARLREAGYVERVLDGFGIPRVSELLNVPL